MAARRAQTPRVAGKTGSKREKDGAGSNPKTARLEASPERAAKAGAKKPAAKTRAKKPAEKARPAAKKLPALAGAKRPAAKAETKKKAAKKPAEKAQPKKAAAKTSAAAAGRARGAKPAPKETSAKPPPTEQADARDDEAIATPSSPDEPPPTPTETEGVPAASPSERLLAARAAAPAERPLTDEEREAMAKVSETARRYVGAEGAPHEIVGSIASFVDDVRAGKREEPKSQDVRLGLGVLWGEQLRAQVGWRWVHLTYPDGFASYALVPDDRAFACFPLNRVPEAFHPSGPNTSAHVFESIREGALPARKPNAYLVIG